MHCFQITPATSILAGAASSIVLIGGAKKLFNINSNLVQHVLNFVLTFGGMFAVAYAQSHNVTQAFVDAVIAFASSHATYQTAGKGTKMLVSRFTG